MQFQDFLSAIFLQKVLRHRTEKVWPSIAGMSYEDWQTENETHH